MITIIKNFSNSLYSINFSLFPYLVSVRGVEIQWHHASLYVEADLRGWQVGPVPGPEKINSLRRRLSKAVR